MKNDVIFLKNTSFQEKQNLKEKMSAPVHFYYDYELTMPMTEMNRLSDLPDVSVITSFPTSHFGGAYIQSYTQGYGSSSFEKESFGTQSFSLESSFSIDQKTGKFSFDSGYASIGNDGADRDSLQDSVETQEVKLFWSRYNDYPQYLKRIKKRNKSKERKAKKMLSKN